MRKKLMKTKTPMRRLYELTKILSRERRGILKYNKRLSNGFHIDALTTLKIPKISQNYTYIAALWTIDQNAPYRDEQNEILFLMYDYPDTKRVYYLASGEAEEWEILEIVDDLEKML